MHTLVELRHRPAILDHEIRTRAFELGRHLSSDHRHGFGLLEPAIADEALQAEWPRCVDEDDAVEGIGTLHLEEQRDVAHDDAVAAAAGIVDQPVAKTCDFRVHDPVELLELVVVGEHDSTQRRSIEIAVTSQYHRPPATDDLFERRCAPLHGAVRENVCVDDGRAALGEQSGDGRFSRGDIPRESDEQHWLGARSWDQDGCSPTIGENLVKRKQVDQEAPAEHARYAELVSEQLALLGEDPKREGLVRTPQRVAGAMAWLTRGYAMDVRSIVGNAIFAESHENMVMVRDIELYSMCEHHMLPFFGKAHVAYIPNGRIVGLSKLPRIVDAFARRLQVQERMTEEIAAAVDEVLEPRGVGVVIEAVHLCMMMRGVEKQNSRTITSALRGIFRTDARTREEFLALVRGSHGSALP
jgi:GTP cyclohydrolase I